MNSRKRSVFAARLGRPARHYEWKGRTFAEALDKAEKEIDGRIGAEVERNENK